MAAGAVGSNVGTNTSSTYRRSSREKSSMEWSNKYRGG